MTTLKHRTSQSHPLQIAEVRAAPGYGAIGITFCPGKQQSEALTGGWQRDLDLDLEVVRDWDAVAVITLVEESELEMLGVLALGDAIRARHMIWHHLPIADVSVPSSSFERSWSGVGEGLRSALRNGFNVLVHCKGGMGRAGTIAARLLVELGCEPQVAIDAVRKVRPGAIETDEQRRHVLSLGPLPEIVPDTSAEAVRSRAIGALLGLAIGDAIGTTLEFSARDTYQPLTDMVGGGPFRLRAGQWTDDTAMALALADSFRSKDDFDPRDLMERFVRWHEDGEYSCTGTCFDIGITTSTALSRWKRTGNPFAGSTNPQTAGNGSLMRLAPVAIRFWRDRETMRDVAARQSRTTHGAPEAVDACIAWAEVLADAIEGRPRSEVLRDRIGPYAGAIGSIMAGSWRGKPRQEIEASGYVAHSLEASLWSVGRSGSFAEAVLVAANLGQDADTTAAITGQLAGALYGLGAIPGDWIDKVAWSPRIRAVAEELLQ